MLAAYVVVFERSRLDLGELESVSSSGGELSEVLRLPSRTSLAVAGRPTLNRGSRPDASRCELGFWSREIGVRGCELIDTLSRDSQQGRYLGDAEKVMRHPQRLAQGQLDDKG